MTRGEPTVRGLLDAGADRVRKELAGQPEAAGRDADRARDESTGGSGVYDQAQPLLEQALVVGRPVFGPAHVRLAQTLNDLGVLLSEKGDYKRQRASLEEALDMRRNLLGREHTDVAITLVELGRVYQDQGRTIAPSRFNAKPWPSGGRCSATHTGRRRRALSDLASVLRLNGDLQGAESMLQLCLATNLKALGEDHPNSYTPLHDMALVAGSRKDFRAAESLFRQALARGRKTLGEWHPAVAMTLNGSVTRVVRAGKVRRGRFRAAGRAAHRAAGARQRASARRHL